MNAMNDKFQAAAVAFVLTLSLVSQAIASQVTCAGEIWKVSKDEHGVRWLEIGHGIYQCTVKVQTAIGRKILSVCHVGGQCTLQVEVGPRSEREMMNNGIGDLDVDEKDRLVSVRAGALDDTGAKSIVNPEIIAFRCSKGDRESSPILSKLKRDSGG
jgi:hypothetical protein